jgi:hypothetical protein
MNEAKFWTTRVRPLIVRAYPGVFVERIENGLSAGTPDVHYAWRSKAGWIENKFREATPQRSWTTVFGDKGLRKEQIAWWLTYLHAGGTGYICAGVGRSTWMITASPPLVRTFNDMTWAGFQELAPVGLDPLRLIV